VGRTADAFAALGWPMLRAPGFDFATFELAPPDSEPRSSLLKRTV